MDVRSIRARIRGLLDSGELPGEGERTWAGPGRDGTHCVGCGERIGPSEIEYEVEVILGGPVLRLHRLCYAIWREERPPQPTADAA